VHRRSLAKAELKRQAERRAESDSGD
jgi:hypothetical protein